MKIFGAITAVYLGLYLVLPGCLCQLLHCFGLVSPTSESQQVDSTYLSDSGGNTICHCHEVVSKNVELPPSIESVPAPVQDFASAPEDWDSAPAFFTLIKSSGPRAPPLRLRALTTLRSFTGVYLI